MEGLHLILVRVYFYVGYTCKIYLKKIPLGFYLIIM